MVVARIEESRVYYFHLFANALGKAMNLSFLSSAIG